MFLIWILLTFLHQTSGLSTHIEGNTTSSQFKLIYPDEGAFTIFYDQPPARHNVVLYVDKHIKNFTVSIESTQTNIARISDTVDISSCLEQHESTPGNTTTGLSLQKTGACYNVSFLISAPYIGYSTAKFYADTGSAGADIYLGEAMIRSMRQRKFVDFMYTITVKVMFTLMILVMGNDLDVQTIKEHFRRPKALIVAFVAQYTIMPALSYGTIWMLGYTGSKALGFFAMGCSPGGGISNMYAKLFNGDLSISITMTTINTAASLGMLPLLLYTLGATIPADEGVDQMKIPFLSILESLAMIVVPLAIGALIQFKLPRISLIIRKGLNILLMLILLVFLMFTVFVNNYIFVKWDAELMLASCLLPYGGYLLGGLMAWACRLNWMLIKTISIETGLQNTAVSLLVAMSLASQPDVDLAIILPIASTIVSAAPFYIMLPVYLVRERILNKIKAKREADTESGDNSEIGDEKLEMELNNKS